MIEKVIHGVWIGEREKSQREKECIETRNILQGYEFKEWTDKDEEIYNAIQNNEYAKKAYELKRYAFVSDYIRLYVLYNYGGIYSDYDVKFFKPFDDLLNEHAFTGFESIGYPVCCIMACESHNPVIKDFLDWYNNKEFTDYSDATEFVKRGETNTAIMSAILQNLGIDRYKDKTQTLPNITVFDSSYFMNDEGYCHHIFNGGW